MTAATPAPIDPETELRTIWDGRGIPAERQDEILNQITNARVVFVPHARKFRVLWEIDVEAETPHAAAVAARAMQTGDTTALVFTVVETGGETYQVDLAEQPAPAPDSAWARAQAEAAEIRAAGHQAKVRPCIHGAEIEITRQGFGGPETSFRVISEAAGRV